MVEDAGVSVSVETMRSGSCRHIECMAVRGGSFKPVSFPALFTLIEHPKHGPILFDTGYASQALNAMGQLPNKLYKWLLPIDLGTGEAACTQLQNQGISPNDIRIVVISHFHVDHIAGLGDFPKATYVATKSAWESVRHLSGWSALRNGFFPSIIPSDFNERLRIVESYEKRPMAPELSPFSLGYDLCGDGTVMAIELPGHACGQLGLCAQATGGQWTLLAADSCWLSRAFRDRLMPNPIAQLLLENREAYRETLNNLHMLYQSNKNIRIVPSHCAEAFGALP